MDQEKKPSTFSLTIQDPSCCLSTQRKYHVMHRFCIITYQNIVAGVPPQSSLNVVPRLSKTGEFIRAFIHSMAHRHSNYNFRPQSFPQPPPHAVYRFGQRAHTPQSVSNVGPLARPHLRVDQTMAPGSSTSRNHNVDNSTNLSINTSRNPPRNIIAVRASPQPDPRFNPTAPPFVNSPSSLFNSTIHALNMPSQGHSPPEHGLSPTNHQAHVLAQDQTSPAYQQVSSTYGQNLTPRSSAIRISRPGLVSACTSSPPYLARPSSSSIQHSPPRRPYHEATVASPVGDRGPSTLQTSQRNFLLYQRLTILHEMRKQNLALFVSANAQINPFRAHLQSAWEQPDANERLQDLYTWGFYLQEAMKFRDDYGREYERLGEEIEEVRADINVPHEARAEGNEGGL